MAHWTQTSLENTTSDVDAANNLQTSPMVFPTSRGSQHLPVLCAYHQPDGKRHLAKDVGAVGGDRRDTSAPQDGVQPGLIHSVEIHAQVCCHVVSARRKRGVSPAIISASSHWITESLWLWKTSKIPMSHSNPSHRAHWTCPSVPHPHRSEHLQGPYRDPTTPMCITALLEKKSVLTDKLPLPQHNVGLLPLILNPAGWADHRSAQTELILCPCAKSSLWASYLAAGLRQAVPTPQRQKNTMLLQ